MASGVERRSGSGMSLAVDVADLIVDCCCLGVVVHLWRGLKAKYETCTEELMEEREWMREQFVELGEFIAAATAHGVPMTYDVDLSKEPLQHE